MQKKLTLLFGIVLTLVTLSNFIPGMTEEKDGTKYLMGIFQVGTALLVLHLIIGLALVAFGAMASSTRGILTLTGVVFALVAVIGWIQGDSVLGIMNVNAADNGLHSFFAVFLLGLAFGLKDRAREPIASRR